MNEQIDNEKKLRIELKKLVTFGDYEETLKKTFDGFLHILEKCKSQKSNIDDFRVLEHITETLSFQFRHLNDDIEEIRNCSEFHSESYEQKRIDILTNQKSHTNKHTLPVWYVDKLLVETHERIKKECSDLYKH
jgi:hypothetical protein